MGCEQRAFVGIEICRGQHKRWRAAEIIRRRVYHGQPGTDKGVARALVSCRERRAAQKFNQGGQKRESSISNAALRAQQG
jgi:hypothetical protein